MRNLVNRIWTWECLRKGCGRLSIFIERGRYKIKKAKPVAEGLATVMRKAFYGAQRTVIEPRRDVPNIVAGDLAKSIVAEKGCGFNRIIDRRSLPDRCNTKNSPKP